MYLSGVGTLCANADYRASLFELLSVKNRTFFTAESKEVRELYEKKIKNFKSN